MLVGKQLAPLFFSNHYKLLSGNRKEKFINNYKLSFNMALSPGYVYLVYTKPNGDRRTYCADVFEGAIFPFSTSEPIQLQPKFSLSHFDDIGALAKRLVMESQSTLPQSELFATSVGGLLEDPLSPQPVSIEILKELRRIYIEFIELRSKAIREEAEREAATR